MFRKLEAKLKAKGILGTNRIVVRTPGTYSTPWRYDYVAACVMRGMVVLWDTNN